MLKKWENGEAAVWLTDRKQEAERLCREGGCVVFVLTGENRGEYAAGVEWCAEADDGWGKQCGRTLEEQFDPDWLFRVWQRHAGLPWKILETERLILREMTEKDMDALYEIQGEEESGFLDPLCKDREEQHIRIQEYIRHMYGFYGFGIWMMEEKKSGCVVGRAGLQIRDGFESPELGFAVAPAFRGRGYAEEACRAVMEYSCRELGFEEIRAVVRRENKKSQRLCEKLGFSVDSETGYSDGMWIFYRKQQILQNFTKE